MLRGASRGGAIARVASIAERWSERGWLAHSLCGVFVNITNAAPPRSLALALALSLAATASPALAEDDAAGAAEPSMREDAAPPNAISASTKSNDSAVVSEGSYPQQFSRRPLTLPPSMLSPEVGFSIAHLESGLFAITSYNVRLGAEFGVLPNLTVEATPIAVNFGDASGYGIASLGATYRFLDTGTIEVGGRARLRFDEDPNVGLAVGLPVRAHLLEGNLRLDTGINLGLVLPNGGSAKVGLQGGVADFLRVDPGIPLVVDYSFTPSVFAGASTGLGVVDFGNFGDTVFFPLGLRVGGTLVPAEAPMIDVIGGFGFPLFISSIVPNQTVTTELWTIDLSAKAYFQL
jgi:hypothetical protein